MTALYLVLGGSLGTLARYFLTGQIDDWTGPRWLGVFAVNIIGSFVIGLFLTLSEERFMWPSELRVLIAVGFLGAFTTFSTLTWESMQMLQLHDVVGASMNLALSIVCGMLAVYGGVTLARIL
jgi:CrcB protein